MYLVNPLSLQLAQQLFLTTDRLRVGIRLQGPQNGVNTIFTSPEKFTHNLPFIDLSLYLNGSRLNLLDDYLVFESTPGQGFDTVQLLTPPLLGNDVLIADYVTVL